MKSYFFKELRDVLSRPDVWLYMAWIDIKLRYRRTKLGPLWLVIVSFISIVCIAGLGSLLFRVKFGDFFPYVTCGMVVWQYMSAMIVDSCIVFIAQTGIIKHINVPLLGFAIRMFCRNSIVFFHSLVVVIMVLIYYQTPVTFALFILLPAFFVFFVTAVSLSVILGFVCTRFRDILQLVQALIGILAFLTPIMWESKMLGEHAWLVNFNPLTHYVSIIRDPLLGIYPSKISIVFVAVMTSVCVVISSALFDKYRKRLVHWL